MGQMLLYLAGGLGVLLAKVAILLYLAYWWREKTHRDELAAELMSDVNGLLKQLGRSKGASPDGADW